MDMHVLEIQMMSGGLIVCAGYMLYSTVVVYMFNFMTYPKCSTYAPLCFSVIFIQYRIAFFWFSSLKTNGLREQEKLLAGFCGKHRICSFRLLLVDEMIKRFCSKP